MEMSNSIRTFLDTTQTALVHMAGRPVCRSGNLPLPKNLMATKDNR